MEKKRRELFLKIIIALAVISIIISGYLVKEHYDTGSSICDFSETLSCSLVNSSIYSEIFNIPVALLGMLWGIFAVYYAVKMFKDEKFSLALYGWSLFGLLSVFYFIAAEFILGALCPFCTIVHVLVVAILILSIKIHFAKEKRPKWQDIKKKMGASVIWLIVLFVAFFIFFNFATAPSEDYTEFAQCLNDKGIQMYGSFTCGHCANQKEAFGDAFEEIGEIECHPDGENSQTSLCLEKDVTGTPTWIWEENGVEVDRLVGFQELETLAAWSGCELPSG